jgi:hypothetical protein
MQIPPGGGQASGRGLGGRGSPLATHEKTPPWRGFPERIPSVACDDKHRLARFLLLLLAQGDELAEALLHVLDSLVRVFVDFPLTLLDEGERLRQSLPHDGCLDVRAARLERLGAQILGGIRLAVICFTEVSDAARAGRKPSRTLLALGVLALASPPGVDVNSHDGDDSLITKPFSTIGLSGQNRCGGSPPGA